LNLSEIIQDVRSRLDEDTAGFWTDPMITRWVNLANIRLSMLLENLEAVEAQDILASQSNYSLPSDFLRMVRITCNSIPLAPIEWRQLGEYESEGNPATGVTGTPESWYIWAGNVYLYPVPPSAITGGLMIYYYKRPAALIEGDDEPDHDEQFHELLSLYACYLGYTKDMQRTEARDCLAEFTEGVSLAQEFLAIDDRQESSQLYYAGE